MSSPKNPTAQVTELFDPLLHSPPLGVNLMLINEGGCLIIGPWYPGAMAWGFKPKIPRSVKTRLAAARVTHEKPDGA